MKPELYACVYAAEFPSQALLRLRPDLQSLPIAVLDGLPPLEEVCSMNRAARRLGASQGMTRLEAEALVVQTRRPRSRLCVFSLAPLKSRPPRASSCWSARHLFSAY